MSSLFDFPDFRARARCEQLGRAMIEAARTGKLATVRSSLGNGGDNSPNVDFTDDSDRTALSHAAENGHTDIVLFLLKKRATVDNRGSSGTVRDMTPLMYAAVRGHKDVVQVLDDRGASRFKMNSDNKTALDLSSTDECSSMLRRTKTSSSRYKRAKPFAHSGRRTSSVAPHRRKGTRSRASSAVYRPQAAGGANKEPFPDSTDSDSDDDESSSDDSTKLRTKSGSGGGGGADGGEYGDIRRADLSDDDILGEHDSDVDARTAQEIVDAELDGELPADTDPATRERLREKKFSARRDGLYKKLKALVDLKRDGQESSLSNESEKTPLRNCVRDVFFDPNYVPARVKQKKTMLFYAVESCANGAVLDIVKVLARTPSANIHGVPDGCKLSVMQRALALEKAGKAAAQKAPTRQNTQYAHIMHNVLWLLRRGDMQAQFTAAAHRNGVAIAKNIVATYAARNRMEADALVANPETAHAELFSINRLRMARHGINQNKRDQNGNTPLLAAAMCGHRDFVKYLCVDPQMGVDLSIVGGRDSWFPDRNVFHVAAYLNIPQLVLDIIDTHAAFRYSGAATAEMTESRQATFAGIARGWSRDHRIEAMDASTVLQGAGPATLARLAAESVGAKILNEGSVTPLHIACAYGDLGMVKALLTGRADAEQSAATSGCPLGLTPLRACAYAQQVWDADEDLRPQLEELEEKLKTYSDARDSVVEGIRARKYSTVDDKEREVKEISQKIESNFMQRVEEATRALPYEQRQAEKARQLREAKEQIKKMSEKFARGKGADPEMFYKHQEELVRARFDKLIGALTEQHKQLTDKAKSAKEAAIKLGRELDPLDAPTAPDIAIAHGNRLLIPEDGIIVHERKYEETLRVLRFVQQGAHLLKLVESGNELAVREHVKEHGEFCDLGYGKITLLDYANADGNTALHLAVSRNDNMWMTLVALGANLYATNHAGAKVWEMPGMPPIVRLRLEWHLHAAKLRAHARAGRAHKVHHIVNDAPKPRPRTRDGIEIVVSMVELVDTQDLFTGNTALHECVREGCEEERDRHKLFLDLLDVYKANPNVQNTEGETPLHLALSRNGVRNALARDPFRINLLASLTPERTLPRLQTSVIEALLRHNVDVSLQARDAESTLKRVTAVDLVNHIWSSIWANALRRSLTAQLVGVSKGAGLVDFKMHLDERYMEQLDRIVSLIEEHADKQAMCQAARMGDEKRFETLFEKVGSVDYKGPDGNTSLHLAAMHGRVYLAERLVDEWGADPTIRNDMGNTPADEVLKQLSEARADAGDDGSFAVPESDAPADAHDGDTLPDGWSAAIDEASGHFYYVHEGSGATTWERPVAADAATGAAASAATTTSASAGAGAAAGGGAAIHAAGARVSALEDDEFYRFLRRSEFGKQLMKHIEVGADRLAERVIEDSKGEAAAFSDAQGRHPLHVAAWRGRAEVVKALLALPDAGRQCLKPDWKALMPLHYAAFYGHRQCLLLLLGRDPATGAQVPSSLALPTVTRAVRHVTAKRLTPLMLASLAGKAECAQVLLTEKDVQLGVKDDKNITPLMYAVGNSSTSSKTINTNLTIVETLVASTDVKVNDADSNGRTPLLVACMQGRLRYVQVLLRLRDAARSPDPNVFDNEGFSPLMYAAKKGAHTLIRKLIAAGADKNGVDHRTRPGRLVLSALHCAIMRSDLSVVRQLVDEHSADIGEDREESVYHTPNLMIMTPLQMALAHAKSATGSATHAMGEVAAFIYDRLIFFTLLTDIKRGDNASVRAAVRENPELVLARHPRTQQLALHTAILRSQTDCVLTLLNAGAPVLTLNDANTLVDLEPPLGEAPDPRAQRRITAFLDRAREAQKFFHWVSRSNKTKVLSFLTKETAAAPGSPSTSAAPAARSVDYLGSIGSPATSRTTAAGDTSEGSDDGDVMSSEDEYEGGADARRVQPLRRNPSSSVSLTRTFLPHLVNARNERGKTPLHVAALKWGAEDTTCGECRDIMRALLKAGADVNAQDCDGETALFDAVRSRQPDCVRLLLDAGALPQLASSPPGDLPPQTAYDLAKHLCFVSSSKGWAGLEQDGDATEDMAGGAADGGGASAHAAARTPQRWASTRARPESGSWDIVKMLAVGDESVYKDAISFFRDLNELMATSRDVESMRVLARDASTAGTGAADGGGGRAPDSEAPPASAPQYDARGSASRGTGLSKDEAEEMCRDIIASFHRRTTRNVSKLIRAELTTKLTKVNPREIERRLSELENAQAFNKRDTQTELERRTEAHRTGLSTSDRMAQKQAQRQQQQAEAMSAKNAPGGGGGGGGGDGGDGGGDGSGDGSGGGGTGAAAAASSSDLPDLGFGDAAVDFADLVEPGGAHVDGLDADGGEGAAHGGGGPGGAGEAKKMEVDDIE